MRPSPKLQRSGLATGTTSSASPTAAPNVTVMPGTRVRALTGDRTLEAVEVEDCHTGEQRTLPERALVRLHRRRTPHGLAGKAARARSRRLRPDRAGRGR